LGASSERGRDIIGERWKVWGLWSELIGCQIVLEKGIIGERTCVALGLREGEVIKGIHRWSDSDFFCTRR